MDEPNNTNMEAKKGLEALEATGRFSVSEDLRRAMAEYPDLDLEAAPGTRVRPVYLDGKPYHGHDYDREQVAKHLKEGEIYTIANIECCSWSSSVELVEVPGVSFNSVCLSPVD